MPARLVGPHKRPSESERIIRKTIEAQGVDVGRIYRSTEPDAYTPWGEVLFVTGAGLPNTARVWPNGECVVEAGW